LVNYKGAGVKWSLAISRYYPGICMGEWKNHKNLSQDSECPDQDSNWHLLNTSPIHYYLSHLPWSIKHTLFLF